MNIKSLCLGTVQFGLKYGINNKKGKPSIQEVFYMLDYARDCGIEIFDTAVAYGDAEERLGKYISKNRLGSEFRVISKLKPNLFQEDIINTKNTKHIVKSYVVQSLKNLKVEVLEGYLLHTPTDFYNESVIEGLLECKRLGLVKNIGISIYEMKHAQDAVNSDQIDYIQIPYNIFDQRADTTELYRSAEKKGIKVFARSPFLQGLLTMEHKDIPNYLSQAKEYMRKLESIISRLGMTKIEAAIAFASYNDKNDYVVLGVDDMEQLNQNIKLFTSNNINSDFIAEVKKEFCELDKSIIFPSLWFKKY